MPWFVDWNAYRSTFEREAEKILGQPVHVAGTAQASLLPMPSLAFTDVRVGGTPDHPMMTIQRFALRIELMPLVTGQIKVVEMAIDHPHVEVTVDGNGVPDWLKRTDASKSLNPDAVSLDRVDISGGELNYRDTRSGHGLTLSDLNASVDARSLLGPWKLEGGAAVNGTPTTFRIATGRRENDGTIRVKLDASPASMPIAFSAEGPIGFDVSGLLWSGDFSLSHVADIDPANPGQAPDAAQSQAGWRASGQYQLRPDRLQLPALTVSQGPDDRLTSLMGSADIDLGRNVSFDALMKAPQLDLDRSLGKGPDAAVRVQDVTTSLSNALANLPRPPIPGRIDFDIPAIIAGGAVVQNLKLTATSVASGWQIDGLGADLPGKTRISAAGTLRMEPQSGFTGDVRISSQQPATFAAWWRGGRAVVQPGLLPFDVSGQLELGPGVVSLGNIAAKTEDSNIRGSVDWRKARDGKRDLAVDLKANTLDYDQIDSLARLFAGHGAADVTGIADDLQLRIATGSLNVGDVVMKNVAADGSLADGALTMNRLSIGDLAGAALTGKGRIADLATTPNGQISVSINASSLSGSVPIVDRLLPGSPVASWFRAAAPALGPAKLSTVINAQAAAGATNANLTVNGSAGGSDIDLALGFNGALDKWRSAAIKLSLALDNPDAGRLVQQFGQSVVETANPGRVHLVAEGNGTLAGGIDTTVKGDFAGLNSELDGKISADPTGQGAFHGTLSTSSADASHALSMVAPLLPGLNDGIRLAVGLGVDIVGAGGSVNFRDATIGPARASGTVGLAYAAGRWSLQSSLSLDQADLGFLADLGLGAAADPLGGALDGPWSKASFGSPVIDGVDASVHVNADHLKLGSGLAIANATLSADYKGDRTEIAVASGTFAGGPVSGRLSIANTEGNATVSGQFTAKGGALGDIAWQKDGRSVADGPLDISGQFEGTGRSMAGLVSSLSGGGSFHVGAGSARFVNPQAFASVIRAADSGKTFSETELRTLFASYLDAGTLDFKSLVGTFSITAGTIRAPNIDIASDSATTTGGATIDLNQQTIDSQWTLTVDPGADKVSGAEPQVGLVFSGPLDAPTRKIDVAPLAGFLSILSFEHEVERIEKLQADILEKEKLTRLVRFYRDAAADRAGAAKRAAADAAQKAAEDAAAAAQKAADQAAALKQQQDAARKAAADAAKRAAADAAKKAADAAKLKDEQGKKAAADAAAKEQQQFEKTIESILKSNDSVPLIAPQAP